MVSTLDGDVVAGVLDRGYRAAREQGARPRGSSGPRDWPGMSAQERADAMSEVYMTISPATGRLAYSLIRAARPETVVEFGTSFGLSTIYLAAAVRDNGIGHVYTTEMNEDKIRSATATFVEAGLDDLVTVLAGDARQTLAGVPGPVGMVLLDGWKELYLPVLRQLADRLTPGAVLLADNAESPDLADYLEHVRTPANGYTSVNLPGKRDDSVELSTLT